MPRFIPRRRRRKVRTSHGTYGDSNRAVEVIDDNESDAVLDDVSSSNKGSDNIPMTNSFFRNILIEDCLNAKEIPFSKDYRQLFPDLVQLSQEMKASLLFGSGSLQSHTAQQQIFSTESRDNLTTMQRFQNKISIHDLYEKNDPDVDVLLEKMATMKIKHIVEYPKGTQLKLIVTFDDGSQALLKPMRFERKTETNPNHFYFTDFERHNSEIAAFHLDRILGFRRCPPVTGRKMNLKMDLYDNAEKELKKTFFISPADNICFHGNCKQYCDTGHAICGQPAIMEVSLAALLLLERKKWKNPWRRSYSKRNPMAEWETNNLYCQVVRQQALYNNSKRLADLMDIFILDFLIGNMDRHTYETFTQFGNDSFILHLDQGRGFGRANHDELSILTPLKQCCFLHSSTFHRLVDLQHSDIKLSSQMRCSLFKDALFPILSEAHLEALDRRLQIILHTIRECLQKQGMNNVFY
ncbi:extracellular serine/threonine protein CG31145-like [Argiope bruennichi]|uniref:extracellular serine/threonine protein CG31145-like n=1 Tax=Argiope bruennichi TaxID=94029 RepID=UPI002494D0B9|nr:extracellular serine/threonine protein CG31145-like [Argiope bruennichi]